MFASAWVKVKIQNINGIIKRERIIAINREFETLRMEIYSLKQLFTERKKSYCYTEEIST